MYTFLVLIQSCIHRAEYSSYESVEGVFSVKSLDLETVVTLSIRWSTLIHTRTRNGYTLISSWNELNKVITSNKTVLIDKAEALSMASSSTQIQQKRSHLKSIKISPEITLTELKIYTPYRKLIHYTFWNRKTNILNSLFTLISDYFCATPLSSMSDIRAKILLTMLL